MAAVVLMDFDGVLAREDSMLLFFRHHLLQARWKIAPTVLAATPAFALFAHRPSRPLALRAMVRVSLAGWTLDRYERAARLFGAELGIEPGAMIADGVAAARAHLTAGDRVIVVTGSEQTLVRAVLDAAGLPEAELIASTLKAEPLGLALDHHNFGPGKLVGLAAHGISPTDAVAYSDSLNDLPMLEAAGDSVLVNFSARKLARARELLPTATAVSWS